MAANTIIPPRRAAGAKVSDAPSGRWVPATRVTRDIDLPTPSAYPEARRFSTIYPGTQASHEATNAAFAAARDHDRSSSSILLDVLQGRREADDSDDA